MSKPVIHQYSGPSDLRRMQNLTQSIWTPQANYHIGDLAWQRFQHVGRESEWVTAIWEIADQPVAWGWLELPGELSFQVHPDYPELASDVLRWLDDVSVGGEQTVTILETECHLMQALEQASYEPSDTVPSVHLQLSLDKLLPSSGLPTGFKARHLRGSDDIAQRIAVHKAAFHPSRVSEESYVNVMKAYPYDCSLDWVIESPSGEFAAYCLIWFDTVNGVGLLEPVGTHPDYRRMGLASTVCILALEQLRKKGAKTAIVGTGLERRGKPYPDAFELYKSIGFQPIASTKSFRRRNG